MMPKLAKKSAEKITDPLWLQSDKTPAQQFYILNMLMNARREMDEGPLEYFTEQKGEGMWLFKSRPRVRSF